MIWHFLEVWGLLLVAFAVGGVLGTGLHVVLAATSLAESQAALIDEIDERLAAIGNFLGRRREAAPDFGVNRELPAYVAPLPIPPPIPHDGESAYAEPGYAEAVDAALPIATTAWTEESHAEELSPISDIEDFLEDVDPDTAAGWDDDEVRWAEESAPGPEIWDAEHWPDEPGAEDAVAESHNVVTDDGTSVAKLAQGAGSVDPEDAQESVEPEPEPLVEEAPAPEVGAEPPVPVAVIPGTDAPIAEEALPPRPPEPEPEPSSPEETEPEAELPVTRPLTLPGPRNGVPDNLQRIRGIGQKNEALLNSFGIYHFGQIAAWTPAEARWVASHLAFPERIERDDWIGQAIVIATGGDTGYVKRRRKSDEGDQSAAR